MQKEIIYLNQTEHKGYSVYFVYDRLIWAEDAYLHLMHNGEAICHSGPHSIESNEQGEYIILTDEQWLSFVRLYDIAIAWL